MMRFLYVTIAFVVMVTVAFTFGPRAQEDHGEKKILVIAGDLNRPYDVLDGILIMKTVKSTFTGNPFQKAVSEAMAELKETATKVGGDAVINVSIQPMLGVVKGPSGEMGELIVFGTVVKLKTD
jgi:uncharacterized protein YbjQ (UPF0145 family)